MVSASRGAHRRRRPADRRLYGAVFNVETVIAGFFREKSPAGAFAGCSGRFALAPQSRPNYVLAGPPPGGGYAALREDATSVLYSVSRVTAASRGDVVEALERGDVTGLVRLPREAERVDAPDDAHRAAAAHDHDSRSCSTSGPSPSRRTTKRAPRRATRRRGRGARRPSESHRRQRARAHAARARISWIPSPVSGRQAFLVR